jgi:FdhE protein
MITEDRVVEPVQLETPVGEPRFLSLAGSDLFPRRGVRFRDLASGHPWGDYLVFLGLLADAQQEALHRFPSVPLPDPKHLMVCRDHGMPPLGAGAWSRSPVWRSGLEVILRQLAEASLPTAARETVDRLLGADANELEMLAANILAGELERVSPGDLPFVAAALQVYWVKMATSLGDESVGRLEQGGVCPVCGSHPLVGIVGSRGGLRYLCCSLCATQWHMVRVTCSSCGATEGVSLYSLEGTNGAVKAESCEVCNSYLKLLYLEQDMSLDPMADDLATLALDLLMTRNGKLQRGANPFFHPGGTSG